jgi:hypothetical protein
MSVNATGYYTGYADPDMNLSQQFTVYLNKIPVDYIIIRDMADDSGQNITGLNYEAGSNHTFYAAGYAVGAGYLGDITVDWSSNNTNTGTVTTPGTNTTFTAGVEHYGPVRITATTGSVNTYADIVVDQAGIDYIVIQDDPTSAGVWVGDMSYDLGKNDTFYSGGYNNTLGYAGTVPAAWTSTDTAVGTVTTPGDSTFFEASTTINGTTQVEASYLGSVNRTGIITVLPGSIDYIEIRSGTVGTGVYVGDTPFAVDDTTVFYAAGYNDTLGYVMDVPADWVSSVPSVGTVTTPGTSTTFTALASGKTQVTATFGPLSNSTGILTVTDPMGIDLTVSITTEPPSPILEGSAINITLTVENLGTETASNFIVHFYVDYPYTSDYVLETNQTIDTLDGGNTVDLVFPNSSVEPAGKYDIKAAVDPIFAITEADETNNEAYTTVEVLTEKEWTVGIRIEPAHPTITSDETVQFNATGIGMDTSTYPIQPTNWSVSGGGTIDTMGLFNATTIGTWGIRADYGSANGSTFVTVTPGAVTAIEFAESNVTVIKGESYQFVVMGIDADGNRFELPAEDIEWTVTGAVGTSVGTIDAAGIFTATSEGSVTVGAKYTMGEVEFNAQTGVDAKEYIVIVKKFNLAGENVVYSINIGFIDDGNATLENIPAGGLADENIPESSFGSQFTHISVFLKIEIPTDIAWDWIYIEVEYDPAALPEGFNPADLELFYFDESSGTWVKAEATGVDTSRNVVYANVTHLTIFAPMAESSGGEPTEEDEGAGIDIAIILGIIAVVFVIAMAAGVIIIRKRRVPGKPAEGEEEREGSEEEMVEKEMVEEERDIDWGEEEDEEDIDLSQLETITTKCPSCKSPIDIEPSFEDKVHLECGECGKKGRMPNPYMEDIERLRQEKKEEDKKEEGELESEVWDDEDEEDVWDKEEEGGVPEPPKPPKRKKPGDKDKGMKKEEELEEESVEEELDFTDEDIVEFDED